MVPRQCESLRVRPFSQFLTYGQGQSQWIPFITHSPVLLHTNLFCWGMHWHGKLTGTEQNIFLHQNPQILEHKVTAIRMINAHLESQAGVTDELLASVAIFINTALQFLNREEAISHMAGLEALVKSRGGLTSLSSLGPVGVLIQRLVSWNDLFYVELFGGQLRFSRLPHWEEAWESHRLPLVDDPVTHLEPLQARFAGDQAHEISTLLRDIQLMCDDIHSRPTAALNTAARTLRHDALFRLERRLCLATRITPILNSDQRAADEATTAMWRAVAYASLMYVHHHMRPGWALQLAQFRALTISLRNELSNTTLQSWVLTPALHIWTLAVGSWVSQRQGWAVQALAAACESHGIESWHAFQTMLRLCPNLGASDEEKFKVIWEDVTQLLRETST
jgi:hypothetical protein